jgi:sugar (pentulose or hexulose) kinase
MVENQCGEFVDVYPVSIVLLNQFAVVLIDVDQRIVGNRNYPFARIAVDGAEGSHLFHVYVFQTCKFSQYTFGIELGSTRIKAVLIDQENKPIAQGSHTWENQLVNGLWTYSIDAIWSGLQDCYADLRSNVKKLYDTELETLAAIGVSAMMHGYMPFNEKEEILVPFRTWRNTNTGRAAAELSELFVYNIPLRWSISHLYQAILDNEAHVKDIKFLTTLAGYVHWQITGEKVLGIGDASGMLPIDPTTNNYSAEMVAKFNNLIASKEYSWKLEDILPKVLSAGENAGVLTPEGCKKLDASGHLKAGIPVCPPEGDAGTGMVATNAVKQRTGNVSAGTSSFSMIVLEKELSKPYEMIDMVTTPDGSLVAMVHCNNCTSDLNAWVNLFKEYQELLGIPVDMDELYGKLYNIALTGDTDCGGLLSYNYISGEPVTGLAEGRPLFVRSANDKFNLANFMRAHLYASVGVLKIGNDILFNEEKIKVDRITGHGGLFRTKGVGQRVLAAAINSPISVMETAGEGGAWGIALLGSYLVNNKKGQSLADFLDESVFVSDAGVEVSPTPEDVAGFNTYIESYKAGLPIEEAAVKFK